ncbi:MAG: hypothetical protein KDH92_13615 [Chloroflexi bacterium]|nr:hypothetical protein [Chloroflexota bacterium]
MVCRLAAVTLLLILVAVGPGMRRPLEPVTAQALRYTAHLPLLLAIAGPVPPARAGGTVVIGQSQEPDTLYLYGGTSLGATHVQNALYDGPIDSRGYDWQPVIVRKLPRLEDSDGSAELATVDVEPGEAYVDSESGEVVTATERIAGLPQITARFRLVPGLAWEDGQPVTADDSVFSQRLNCHEDTPTSKFLCERTADYAALDASTLQWRGLPGFADPTYFTHVYTPLPRHQVGDRGRRMDQTAPVRILDDETFTHRPLSYGPFRIVGWQPGEGITLARNAYYWRVAEGLPYLDAVTHRFYADAGALREALESGEVDVATAEGLGIEQADALDRAARAGTILPYAIAGPLWEHIDFNLDPVDGRQPFGACRDLRHAIALGTDRRQLVAQVQHGWGEILDGYVPRRHWASASEDASAAYTYAPQRARDLLEALGFADRDGDGVREAIRDIECPIVVDATGTTRERRIARDTELRLTLDTTIGNPMREQIALEFQADMAEIGITVDIELIPANRLFEDGPDGPLFGRQFDLGLFAWSTAAIPPADLYRCSAIPSDDDGWSGANETGWCDPAFDKAAARAATTLERATARALYQDAQRRFEAGMPSLPLFLRARVMAASPRLQGIRPDATVSSETWNIEEWRFEVDSEGSSHPAERRRPKRIGRAGDPRRNRAPAWAPDG